MAKKRRKLKKQFIKLIKVIVLIILFIILCEVLSSFITKKTFKLIPDNKSILKGVIYPDNDRAFIEDYINNTK